MASKQSIHRHCDLANVGSLFFFFLSIGKKDSILREFMLLGKRHPLLKMQRWFEFNNVRMANKCINRKN